MRERERAGELLICVAMFMLARLCTSVCVCVCVYDVLTVIASITQFWRDVECTKRCVVVAKRLPSEPSTYFHTYTYISIYMYLYESLSAAVLAGNSSYKRSRMPLTEGALLRRAEQAHLVLVIVT